MIPKEVARGDAAPGLGVDDPHLERVSVEAEVRSDEAQESLDRRVAANGTAAPPGAARPGSPLLQTGSIRLLHQPVEAPPMGSLQTFLGFGLDHRFPFPLVCGVAANPPFHFRS